MTASKLLIVLVGSLQGRNALAQTSLAPVAILPTPAGAVAAALAYAPSGQTSIAPVVILPPTQAPFNPPVTAVAPVWGVVPLTLAPIYPDQLDTGCVPGQSCSDGSLVPPDRGLCVTSAGQNWCWDACNLNHSVTSYSASHSAGIGMMVKQLRTGMRFGSCPGGTFSTAVSCTPGERCTSLGLTRLRGMCITMRGSGNQCLDMCDTSISLDTYQNTPGKQAGTVNIVQMVRAGRDPAGMTTCPIPTIWLWLWFPLLLCCSIGFCALAYYVFTYYRGRLKRTGSSKLQQPEQAYVDNPAPYTDYQDVAPQVSESTALLQSQDQMMDGDIMPVVDNSAALPAGSADAAASTAMANNIFGPPDLRAGLAQGNSMAAPTGTMVSGAQAYPGNSFMQQRPTQQFAQNSTFPPLPAPPYGAYGAYGVPAQPTQSMRIG